MVLGVGSRGTGRWCACPGHCPPPLLCLEGSAACASRSVENVENVLSCKRKGLWGPKQLREPRQTCTRSVTNLSAEAGGDSGEENEEGRADACLGQAGSLQRGCRRTTALKVTPKTCETAWEYTRTATSGRLCRKLRLYKKPEVMSHFP